MMTYICYRQRSDMSEVFKGVSKQQFLGPLKQGGLPVSSG